MAKREILRGMRGVRTLSGINTVNNVPHRIHMKISALEMEKLRFQQEKTKALQRIQTVDQRIQEIDTEVAELLATLNPNEGAMRTHSNPTDCGNVLSSPKSATKSSFPKATNKLVVKY